jgi:hypothetical protein
VPRAYREAIIDRRELVNHLDWVLRPPLPRWLVDQVEHAVELAVAGRTDERIEIDCRRLSVAEAVRDYELGELVDRSASKM